VRFFRLTKRVYEESAFSGEGARRFPGRWNRKGTPMVYCAESLSLAVLECFVHVDAANLPDDLIVIEAELPDEATTRLDISTLPKNWRALPGPPALQGLGDAWARSNAGAGLVVPSAIVPSEWNLLLNPGHPDIAKLRRVGSEPFAFDPRMGPHDS
jgi:RES domain-containing protein